MISVGEGQVKDCLGLDEKPSRSNMLHWLRRGRGVRETKNTSLFERLQKEINMTRSDYTEEVNRFFLCRVFSICSFDDAPCDVMVEQAMAPEKDDELWKYS